MQTAPEVTVNVTTTGSAGSATGSGTSDIIYGEIDAVFINYHASAPSTTVVTISESGGAGRTILTAPAGNTDITYYPRLQPQDTVGSIIPGVQSRFFIGGRKLTVSVTASNALTNAAIVTFIVKG